MAKKESVSVRFVSLMVDVQAMLLVRNPTGKVSSAMLDAVIHPKSVKAMAIATKPVRKARSAYGIGVCPKVVVVTILIVDNLVPLRVV